ncbi:MAG: glycosyltransferase family 2 protein [Bacteroidota bacterium]
MLERNLKGTPPQISVVIPLFNEEESLPELISWIDKVMQGNQFTYEVLLIDDGSKDESWEVVKSLKAKFPAIRGIRFLRNYGKSAALQVGFSATVGKVVITMDADLQDSPDEIPELYKMIAEEGYDLVSGWKKKRFDPISKTIPSKLFNKVTQLSSGIKLHDFNCGLKSYKANVVKTIEVYGEMHRYIPVIAKWNGFYKIGEKVVEHRARKYGNTKFGLERFIFGFLDLLSITFVSRFRKRPMHFFGTMGTLSFILGLIFAAKILLEKIYISNFLHEVPTREVVAQPLFFLSLVMLIIGVQLFLAGIIVFLPKHGSHVAPEN